MGETGSTCKGMAVGMTSCSFRVSDVQKYNVGYRYNNQYVGISIT